MKTLALACLVALVAGEVQGAVKYASPNGTGDGSTPANPSLLHDALTAAGAGGTVVALDGIYNPVTEGSAGGYYTMDDSTASTLISSNQWKAIINNGSNYLHELIIKGTSTKLISGFCMSNSGNCSIAIGEVGASFGNITISNCWLGNNGRHAIDASTPPGVDNLTIDSCLIELGLHGGQPIPNLNGGYGIYLSGKNITIRNCVIRNNGGLGAQWYTGYGTVEMSNFRFYNNLMYGNARWADPTLSFASLAIWKGSGSGDGKAYLCNNTIWEGMSVSGTTVYATNNIFGRFTTSGYCIESEGVVNCYSNLFRADSFGGGGTITFVGGKYVDSTVASSFVATNKGLYWLKNAGPARNKAINNAAFVPKNFFGDNQVTVSDVGFVQYLPELTSPDLLSMDPSSWPDYWNQNTNVAPPSQNVFDQSYVQSNINACALGGTVTLTNGPYSFSGTPLIITNYITLQGQGTNSTFISHSSKPCILFNPVAHQSNYIFRITGIGFTNSDTGWGYGDCSIQIEGTNKFIKDYRIDNCRFAKGGSHLYIKGKAYGLVDNCDFLESRGPMVGIEGDGANSWTEGVQLGSTNCTIVEDCYFQKTSAGSPVWPAIYEDAGARATIRYNTFYSGDWENPYDPIYKGLAILANGHDAYGAGSVDSTLFNEVYNNTFITANNTASHVCDFWGGTLVGYNNSFTNTVGVNASWYLGNFELKEGTDTVWPNTQQITNTFLWNNVVGGVSSNTPVVIRIGTNWFVENRDYFLRAPTNPADSIYPYTALCYPHPLISGGCVPPAVTNWVFDFSRSGFNSSKVLDEPVEAIDLYINGSTTEKIAGIQVDHSWNGTNYTYEGSSAVAIYTDKIWTVNYIPDDATNVWSQVYGDVVKLRFDFGNLPKGEYWIWPGGCSLKKDLHFKIEGFRISNLQ